MATSKQRILMVLTSHDELGSTGRKTGFWLEEFAAPYYVFVDAGADVTLASPNGGQPPLDPTSDEPDFQTDATTRFHRDKEAQRALANTVELSSVSADDFDGIFYPGGHGPLWDLFNNAASIALIEKQASSHKPVAAVCHASAALLNAKVDGDWLVSGKSVTGFSNAEEDAVQLTDVVPYLLEDELKARGGAYQNGENWLPFVVQDGSLITGQNPASSQLTAEKLLEALA